MLTKSIFKCLLFDLGLRVRMCVPQILSLIVMVCTMNDIIMLAPSPLYTIVSVMCFQHHRKGCNIVASRHQTFFPLFTATFKKTAQKHSHQGKREEKTRRP